LHIKAKHILIIRFSSLGDIALTVPVISALIRSYPSVKVSVLTKKQFAPLFHHLSKVEVISVDFQKQYNGVLGLISLSKKISSLNVDFIADFHNVLRTKILKLLLRKHNFQSIDKGRIEKKKLIVGQVLQPLKPTVERYSDVIRSFGFSLNLNNPKFPPRLKLSPTLKEIFKGKSKPYLGIAPFAAHKSKTYPIEKTKKIIKSLSGIYTVILFGGGITETRIIDNIVKNLPSVVSLSGKVSMQEEVQIISHLKLMVSMDSGNAHIAAMMGVKVITLWGVTHPFLGFQPFNQPLENCLLADRKLFPLIPTSVYGNNYPSGYEEAIATIGEDKILQAINDNV